MIAVLGHVDHGKTSVVRSLTGIDPDRLKVEKETGRTTELGFAPMHWRGGTLAEVRADLIDLPGHHRYIANAVAGLHGVDAGLLVVSAVEGWKAQTIEHVRGLEALGVRSLLVALTFADRVDEARLAAVEADVAAMLAGRFGRTTAMLGYSPGDDGSIQRLAAALRELVVAVHRDRRAPEIDRPRLWIDRSFDLRGAGLVVTGTLTGGSLRVGDQLTVCGEDFDAMGRVRSLEQFGMACDEVGPGRRVGVVLAGLRRKPRRGEALVRAEQWDRGIRLWLAIEHPEPLPARGGYQLHLGTARRSARLAPPRFSAHPEVRLARLDRELAGVGLGDRVVLRYAALSSSSATETVAAVVLAVGSARRASGEPSATDVLGRGALWASGSVSPSAILIRLCREHGGAVDPETATRSVGDARAGGVVTGEGFVAEPTMVSALAADLGARAAAEGSATLPQGTLGAALRSLLRTDQSLVLDGHQIRSRDAAARARARAGEAVRGQANSHPHGLVPLATLAKSGVGATLVHDLQADGRVVQVGDWVVPIDRFNLLVARVLPAMARGLATTSELRQVLSIPRSATIALLETMDQRGLCHRVGDRRVPGRAPRDTT